MVAPHCRSKTARRSLCSIVKVHMGAADVLASAIPHAPADGRVHAVLNHPPLSSRQKNDCFFNELANAASTDRYLLSSHMDSASTLSPDFTVSA